MKYSAVLMGIVSVLFLTAGCETAYDLTNADPVPVTSFLPDHQLLKEQKPSFPFRRFWYDKNIDWTRFTKIKIEPVDISHMLSDTWWQKVNPGKTGSMKDDAVQLASYMRNEFIYAIQQDPLCGLTVTNTVDSNTLVLRLAIVKLVPTKAYFDAVGTIADFLVPGASLVNTLNSGVIAMEGMLIDGRNNRIVSMFTDTEKDEGAIIDIEGLTWYGHAKDTLKNWGKEFSQLAETEDTQKLKKPFPFTLIAI